MLHFVSSVTSYACHALLSHWCYIYFYVDVKVISPRGPSACKMSSPSLLPKEEDVNCGRYFAFPTPLLGRESITPFFITQCHSDIPTNLRVDWEINLLGWVNKRVQFFLIYFLLNIACHAKQVCLISSTDQTNLKQSWLPQCQCSEKIKTHNMLKREYTLIGES